MTNKNKPTDNITEGALEALERLMSALQAHRADAGLQAYPKEENVYYVEIKATLQNAQPASVDVGSIKRDLESMDWTRHGDDYTIGKVIDHLAAQGYLHPKPEDTLDALLEKVPEDHLWTFASTSYRGDEFVFYLHPKDNACGIRSKGTGKTPTEALQNALREVG